MKLSKGMMSDLEADLNISSSLVCNWTVESS